MTWRHFPRSWAKSPQAGSGLKRRLQSRRCRRLTLEPLEDRSLLAATITVNSTLDTVAPDNFLTLREALQVNNRTLDVATLSSAEQQQIVGTPTANDTDTIAFNIPGSGVHTITPSSPLPTITDPVVINGYSQPGATPTQTAPGCLITPCSWSS